MKAPILCLFAVLVASSLFPSKVSAVAYAVRSDSGTQCYRLEVPGGITPDPKALIDPDMAYSRLITITAGSAEVAAVGWAGGLQDHDKVMLYSNSGTILGGPTPGGFYNASYVHPTHVERVEGPTPYYLVEMTGVLAGQHQTIYAAVLDDGRLVEPTVVPCRETREGPAPHHHKKWGGAEEKKKWGGAEEKHHPHP
jgi:hypothetical protein